MRRAARFLLVLFELGLLAAIINLFNIEASRHFFPVLCLIIGGFSIHAWLPKERRLTFFAFISVTCVLFVLGKDNGLWVLGIGGALIGICYLPFRFPWQIAVLIAAGALLVFLRVRHPWPFWPVVGSMFMFRIVTFVHECRREQKKPAISESVSYFFLLPNPCFPLFPIVDFKTFRETRYDENEWEIHQRGVAWIARGLSHLLLYRYIKSYLVPEAYELYDVTRIAVFAVTNYLLYMQVSGHFHLVTGLLHLFGFNLPPTHNSYFLASSFSDIWRRINIYWKDFMTKHVFFPTFYALRRRGASFNPAMVLSVFFVFVCTWLFHSWQTFWLLGRFPVTVNDSCLWLGVGALVAINVVFDSRRRPHVDNSKFFLAVGTSVRTVTMFALVSLFWSCWTKPGFLLLIANSMKRPGAVHGVLLILMWLLVAIVIGLILTFFQVTFFHPKVQSRTNPRVLDFGASVKLHLAVLTVVVVFASPASSSLFDTEWTKAIGDFKADPTAAVAMGERLQSYYEDLNMAAIQAGPLLSSFSAGESSRRAQAEGFLKVSRQADLDQGIELIPGIETQLDGSRFTVNQFGMRDRRSITLSKATDTIRIALVGSSIVMGYGVSDDEVFAREFENQLNSQRPDSTRHYEVLNFGVGKQWAPHRLVRIQRQVLGFEPDAIYYFAHQDEFKEIASHAAQLIAYRRPLSSRHLKDVAEMAKANSEQPPGEILGRLARFENELLSAIYRTIVDECQSRKIEPVWIYLPIPGGTADELRNRLIPMALNAGFVVCDLSDWTDQHEGVFRDSEYHPNALGHQLIAKALMRMVTEFRQTLPERALEKTAK